MLIKKTQSIIPVVLEVLGKSRPMAAKISKKPVAQMKPYFAGNFSGSIIDMPLLNLKCPIEVKSSMTDSAIRKLIIISGRDSKAVVAIQSTNTIMSRKKGFTLLNNQVNKIHPRS
jgi:hypothetical protein